MLYVDITHMLHYKTKIIHYKNIVMKQICPWESCRINILLPIGKNIMHTCYSMGGIYQLFLLTMVKTNTKHKHIST